MNIDVGSGSENSLENWEKTNKYLRLDAATRKILTCDVWVKWKAKLPGTNAFITGSTNLKSSAVTGHVKSKFHKQALRLEEQEPAATENKNVRVQLPPVPPDAPIAQTISNMGTLTPEERSAMQNLFDIACMIAYKGRLYSDFVDHVEIEKLNGMQFMSGDPDDFKASLAFLSLKSVESQDAQGITGAIIDAFKECGCCRFGFKFRRIN
ncbi:Hypothetical predicted protein [Paramuricea clavata]|uniref:C17orf113 probable zinc finger domain-containing protein n=1 Tax=Paramuricea clavata TaxID=317549 RepID=A0A6S7HYS5_PARCT|nr:Hypothetical predicted protein [Paramuricea clavata]